MIYSGDQKTKTSARRRRQWAIEAISDFLPVAVLVKVANPTNKFKTSLDLSDINNIVRGIRT